MVKCLSHKYEDLRSIPRANVENLGMVVFVDSEMRRYVDLWGWQPSFLAAQLSLLPAHPRAWIRTLSKLRVMKLGFLPFLQSQLDNQLLTFKVKGRTGPEMRTQGLQIPRALNQ